jgi:hypothetical protein
VQKFLPSENGVLVREEWIPTILTWFVISVPHLVPTDTIAIARLTMENSSEYAFSPILPLSY